MSTIQERAYKRYLRDVAKSTKRRMQSAEERQADDEHARNSLLAYSQRTYPGFQSPLHVRELIDALEWVERTEDARLLVILPPRHSKSVNVSEIFPAWFLGRDKRRTVIGASHTARLARRFSRRVRARVRSALSPFDMRVSAVNAGVDLWEIEGTEGGYAAVGVGGSPAGLGADLLTIDDPIGNQEQASSANFRDSLWEWYRDTMRDRLAPGGRIIITATRWHADDLTGRLLRDMASGAGEVWRIVHMPAIAEEGIEDYLHREPGTPLWPERWNLDRLRALRLAVGERGWNARYQGRPTSAQGNLIRGGWFPRYERIPANATEVLQSWDTSYKTAARHDYTVCITAAVSPTDAYIVDVYREKHEQPDLQRAYKARTLAWRPYESLIEDKASGIGLIQWGRQEPGLPPIIAMPAVGNKEARANDAAPSIEAGRVHLPTSAPWLDTFLEEIQAFPLTLHDDQVDALTNLVARLWLSGRRAQVQSSNYTEIGADPDEEDGDDERW